MFHALAQKKARLDDMREIGAAKHPREDLITSALFGTMTFLTPALRLKAIELVLGQSFQDRADARIELWPGLSIRDRRVEPDVVVTFLGGAAPRVWIVEVKWGAPVGPGQIAREIAAVAGEDPGSVAGYALLGYEAIHQTDVETFKKGAHPGLSFSVIRWGEVAARLEAANKIIADPALLSWVKAACGFLSRTSRGATLVDWPKLRDVAAGYHPFAIETGWDWRTLRGVERTTFEFSHQGNQR